MQVFFYQVLFYYVRYAFHQCYIDQFFLPDIIKKTLQKPEKPRIHAVFFLSRFVIYAIKRYTFLFNSPTPMYVYRGGVATYQLRLDSQLLPSLKCCLTNVSTNEIDCNSAFQRNRFRVSRFKPLDRFKVHRIFCRFEGWHKESVANSIAWFQKFVELKSW